MGWFLFVVGLLILGVGVYWLLTEGISWALLMPIGFMYLSGYLFLDLVLTRLQVRKERLVWVTPFGEKVCKVAEIRSWATSGVTRSMMLLWRKDGSQITIYVHQYEDAPKLLDLLETLLDQVPRRAGSVVLEGKTEYRALGVIMIVLGVVFSGSAIAQAQLSDFFLLLVIGLVSVGGGIATILYRPPTFLLERTGIVKQQGRKKTRYRFSELKKVLYRHAHQHGRVSETIELFFENGKIEIRDSLSNYLEIREKVMEVHPPVEDEEKDKKTQTRSKVLSFFLLGIPVVAINSLYSWMAWPKLQAGVEPVQAVGRVVNTDDEFSRIAFNVGGEEVVFKDMIGQDFDVGQSIPVTYSARNPAHAVAEGSRLMVYAAFNGTVGAGAFGLIVFLMMRRKKKREERG